MFNTLHKIRDSLSFLTSYIQLLTAFFVGGSFTDDDGSVLAFGEADSGGLLHFSLFAWNGTDITVGEFLVAFAIFALGISFIIRLAGSITVPSIDDKD